MSWTPLTESYDILNGWDFFFLSLYLNSTFLNDTFKSGSQGAGREAVWVLKRA